MPGYLVVDVETTGLSAALDHRVVELAAVQVDDDGVLEDSWTTLVNPGRDVGASFVHGITDEQVVAAPTFAQVVPRLVGAAAGRVLVAHNARFDLEFLRSELASVSLPLLSDPPFLCTMELSARFLDGTSRKLNDCCRTAGITHRAGHSAEGDAIATAALLAFYLRAPNVPRPVPWHALLDDARTYAWPVVAPRPDAAPLARREPNPTPSEGWLDRVTSGAERVADPRVESYVDVLEHALLDGVLSAHERADLAALAASLGLAGEQLDPIHLAYFTSLAAAAWSDDVVSWDEQFPLTQVAAALRIPSAVAQRALTDARGTKPAFRVPTLVLSRGDRVSFAKDLDVSGEKWQARALAVGLVPGPLTQESRAFVTGDPDAPTRRAARARTLGVPVIADFAFDDVLAELERRIRARGHALDGP